ncbi:MAG: sirohydrochlorin chelatase [Jatrophihabitans sp.]
MPPPTLIAVAHGTADPHGLAEIRRLVNIVRTMRPDVPIELCWLERAEPRFADLLASLTGPVVVVPTLLSTGYHVKVDITAVAAARPDTTVASPLGPDPRITRVVLERLLAGRGPDQEDVVLFSAGSSDPEALTQLTTVAQQLQRELHLAEGSDYATVHPRMLANNPAWRAGLPRYCDAANYLLAPGVFNDVLRAHAERELSSGYIAAPIGAHPQVAAVLCDRYDEAVRRLPAGLG